LLFECRRSSVSAQIYDSQIPAHQHLVSGYRNSRWKSAPFYKRDMQIDGAWTPNSARTRTSRIRPSGYPFAFRAPRKSEIAGRIVRRRPLTLRYRTGHRPVVRAAASEGSQRKQPQIAARLKVRVSYRQDEIQARIEGRCRDRSPMPRSPADFRERVRSHGALGVSAIYAPVMRSDRSPGDRLRSGVKPSDFELWRQGLRHALRNKKESREHADRD
jgi:hypothetical protein